MTISADAIPNMPSMPDVDYKEDPGAWIEYQQEVQAWSMMMNSITKALETKHQAESSAVNRANANIR